MSRANTTFDKVMQSVAVACDFAMADVTASSALQEKLIHRFNRAWKRCWEAELWEDALEGATITPTAGLIPFSALENARRFALFSEDPLPHDSAAYAIEGKTATTGIQVQSNLGTVYALWIAKPTTWAWTDVAAATAIPEMLVEAAVEMTAGYHERDTGNIGKSDARTEAALQMLEELSSNEFQRVQRSTWRRAFN
jgi:hypothetical protein